MWTNERTSYFLDNYFKLTNTQLANELGIGISTVKRKAVELGLNKSNKIYWDSHKDKELSELYYIKTNQELAEHFNVGLTYIKTVIKRLGLKGKGTEKWSDTEDEILTNMLVEGYTHKQISEKLKNRSEAAVCRRAHSLGLYIGTRRKTSKTFEVEIKEINPNLVLVGEYIDSKTRVTVEDISCGHRWEVVPETILHYNYTSICRRCNPLESSKGELELRNILPEETIYNDRTILKGKELDVYLPEYKVAIEYNGEYWHSDKVCSTTLLEKTEKCNVLGIKLIHIFEHEWINKKDIVVSRINSILGNNKAIYARKCKIVELQWDQCVEFLNYNHLQGAGSPSTYNLGLLYDDTLVSLMTFSKPRFNTNYDYELVRYCSILGTNIVGGASKLLQYFTNIKKRASIISYSDIRWSNGDLYKKLGFSFSHRTKPNYFYFKNFNIVNRYKTQKHKLKKLVPEHYSDNLTESEIMYNAGYIRVYDCGNDVWVRQ